MYPEQTLSSGSSAAKTPVAQSDVAKELMLLEETAQTLRKTTELLCDKLSPVLRSELDVERNVGTPEEILAPLAQEMKYRRVSIQESIREINRIIGRVQL